MVKKNFLLNNSYKDEDHDHQFRRNVIFATNENLRNLFRSRVWFVDETFRCAPSIYFQIFATFAAVIQPATRGETQAVRLLFVYAPSETKNEGANEKVFGKNGIRNCY